MTTAPTEAAADLAELETLLASDDQVDTVVIPDRLPSVEGHPAVIEARIKAAEISAKLGDAEAEEAKLSAVIPRDQRRNIDAARLTAKAEQLVDGPGAAERLDRLNRWAAVRESIPELQRAAQLATTRVDAALDKARRELAAEGKDIFAAAVRAATRKYLAALVELHKTHDLFHKLNAAGVASTINGNPFGGQLPAHAYPYSGLPDRLAALSHNFGLTWQDVSDAAPELIEAGLLTVGHRACFAPGS